MIFVTVGTHEQQFNRLIRSVDNLKRDGFIQEEVFIQTGFSTYVPRYCKWDKLLPYNGMKKMVETARLIITHGGPSSIIMPLQIGKVPIVIPRQKKYGEHVNNHQVEFVKIVSEKLKNIIPVYEITELKNVISGYDKAPVFSGMEIKTNNILFNEKFEKLVEDMF